MAGIGFELRRLVRADRLSANLRGLAYATAVSSGPWLFTCLALVGVWSVGSQVLDADLLRRFSILITYNFSFSLLISGPLVLVVTRCLADAIHAMDVRGVSALFLGALAVLFALTALFGVGLYGHTLELGGLERAAALVGLMLTSGIWLVTTFMSALKSYGVISATFATGMAAAVAGAALLAPDYGSVGLLAGFNLGLAIIFFSLVARVMAEFPGSAVPSLGFLSALRSHWELALVGLTYTAAIWVDKWIMWFAPGSMAAGPGLFAHPTYESSIFLAYLSVVPATALFLIAVETRIYATYVRFFRDISEHASLDEIRTSHRKFVSQLSDGFRRIATLQVAVCALLILAAPALIKVLGGGVELVPVFRYGLFGALFHMLLTLTQTVLAYLDLRRALLAVTTTFLVLNATLTFAATRLGAEYYGYGYALATLLTFMVSYAVVVLRVARLPYLTFIANNTAVRAPRRSPPSPARDATRQPT
jgi:uncharacterized membrane protein